MIALLLTGCIQTVRFPPAAVWDSGRTDTGATSEETEPQGIPLTVESVQGGCNAAGTKWQWTIRTVGWVGSSQLDTLRVSDHSSEAHTLRLVGSDPTGAWDDLQVGPLPDGVAPESQVADVDSRFDCDLDATTLTHVARIRDPWDVLLTCVVWGADPVAGAARVRAIDPEVSRLGGCVLAQPIP